MEMPVTPLKRRSVGNGVQAHGIRLRQRHLTVASLLLGVRRTKPVQAFPVRIVTGLDAKSAVLDAEMPVVVTGISFVGQFGRGGPTPFDPLSGCHQ